MANTDNENVHVYYDVGEWFLALDGREALSPGGVCAKYAIDRGALNNLINRSGIVEAYYYVDPYRVKRFGSVGNSAYCLIPLDQFENSEGPLSEWLDGHYDRLINKARAKSAPR